jgi:hypothetical protein
MKKKKAVKPFDLKRFLIAKLREMFRKSPLYGETKKRAKAEYFEDRPSGKKVRRMHYQCAMCRQYFLDRKGCRDIAVDHIVPVIDPDTGFVDWNTYISRLYCTVDGLQILCNYKGDRDGKRSCHYIKTLKETQQRKTKNED